MPEYLAPGVYVEETSFRSKSIEGTSTSTTAFAGPTRRGPIGETPELITSFPDFERVYGSLDDLEYGPNFLAHSVRAYFNEGGSRLYVSRAYAEPVGGGGRARSDPIVDGAGDDEEVWFETRFPGASGNGVIRVRRLEAQATRRILDASPIGSVALVGAAPAGPARVSGGSGPFDVPPDTFLLLTVDGTNEQIQFRGASAEAVATTPLGANVTLADPTFTVRLGGVTRVLTLPVGPTSRDDLVRAINQRLRGGYARLTGAGEPAGANHLVVGTDRMGIGASVTVGANADLGFAAETTATNAASAANNVADLTAVTIAEINTLLTAAGIDATAVDEGGVLVLQTTNTGAASSLEVRDANPPNVSAHPALGLTVGPAVPGSAAVTTQTLFLKNDAGAWVSDAGATLPLAGLAPASAPPGGASVVTVNVLVRDGDGNENAYEDLGLDAAHPRWIGAVLSLVPARRIDFLEQTFGIHIGDDVTAFDLHDGFFDAGTTIEVPLTGGADNGPPSAADYQAAFEALSRLEDISIVAAPGHSAYPQFQAIQGALIAHVSRPRAYQIAVLDTPAAQTLGEARAVRSRIDSRFAALYYPWITVANPLARPGVENIPREIDLPPSGFVCGIYARNDVERGVHKAPANEVVRGALRFETDINFAEQEVLNPLGINCLRSFPNRGLRVWGARLISSDPEWKYVPVRRYFNYLERSIDYGTQWAVFEPNGERLWSNVRETVASFLYNEWVSGALLGSTPKEAFFVRCDRTTMTQNDLDNGRLICLIGVAVLKPAEFVIFRIGQKTADSRNG
jgi:phage tail sheath protein FI